MRLGVMFGLPLWIVVILIGAAVWYFFLRGRTA